MRLASFNVENLFARPIAMDPHRVDAETRKTVLSAHARLSELFELADYGPFEDEILALLHTLGVRDDDEGEFVMLRKIRGQLLQAATKWSGGGGRGRPRLLGRLDRAQDDGRQRAGHGEHRTRDP